MRQRIRMAAGGVGQDVEHGVPDRVAVSGAQLHVASHRRQIAGSRLSWANAFIVSSWAGLAGPNP